MEDNITSKSTQSKSKLQEKIIKQAQGRSKTNYLCDRVRYTQVSYFGYYVQIIFSYLVAVTIVAVVRTIDTLNSTNFTYPLPDWSC